MSAATMPQSRISLPSPARPPLPIWRAWHSNGEMPLRRAPTAVRLPQSLRAFYRYIMSFSWIMNLDSAGLRGLTSRSRFMSGGRDCTLTHAS